VKSLTFAFPPYAGQFAVCSTSEVDGKLSAGSGAAKILRGRETKRTTTRRKQDMMLSVSRSFHTSGTVLVEVKANGGWSCDLDEKSDCCDE